MSALLYILLRSIAIKDGLAHADLSLSDSIASLFIVTSFVVGGLAFWHRVLPVRRVAPEEIARKGPPPWHRGR